jgi:signal transduction histidine kinase
MDRLSRKIALANALTCVLVLLGFGSIFYVVEENRYAGRTEDIRLLLAMLYEQKREDIGNEIFGRKIISLEDTLERIREIDDIVHVAAYDARGEVLARAGQGGPTEFDLARGEPDQQAVFRESSLGSMPTLDFVTPVVVIGEHVGYIGFRYSMQKLHDESRSTLLTFAGLLVCLLVIVNMTLGGILKRLVIRPVTALKESLDRVRDGNLSERVDLQRNDVIGEMADAFNEMTSSLSAAHDARDEMLAELSRKADELYRANRRLTELDRLKSEFITSVSHELRTPLTSVLGFAKVIRRDFRKHYRNTEPTRIGRRIDDNLDIIQEEGDRLTALINDILDLAKIESGHMEWQNRTIHIEDLFQRAARTTAGLFSQMPDLRLYVQAPIGLPPIKADPDRILQVLINLISNAAKFTSRGSIELNATQHNGSVRISVRDTGVGIPKPELERIFDRFHQMPDSESTRLKPRGVGLGLAICRRIVEHYGGRIWAESTPGVGSTFHVELPAEDGDYAEA